MSFYFVDKVRNVCATVPITHTRVAVCVCVCAISLVWVVYLVHASAVYKWP